jgi:hypothetical protein
MPGPNRPNRRKVGQARRVPLVIHCQLGRACRALPIVCRQLGQARHTPPIGLSPSIEVSPLHLINVNLSHAMNCNEFFFENTAGTLPFIKIEGVQTNVINTNLA